MIDISVDLFQCFINFLIKKLQVEPLHLHGNKSAIKNENNSNKELAEELHKPIIIKLNKRQAQSPFLDNILGDNPADMSLISKFNKKIRDLQQMCMGYSFKKSITIANAFQQISDGSNRKPNKIWVEKGSEFYIYNIYINLYINQ